MDNPYAALIQIPCVATVSVLLPILAVASPAFAQQQPQQQTPLERVLSAKISQELNASLMCAVELLDTKDKLEKAQARIKELEGPKPEAKK